MKAASSAIYSALRVTAGQRREIHFPSAQYFISCHNSTLEKVEPKSGGNEHSNGYDPFTFPFSAITSIPAEGQQSQSPDTAAKAPGWTALVGSASSLL